MNIASYIFLGFHVIFIAGCIAIPVKTVKKIFTALVIPFLLGITNSVLYSFLPDSFHSIFLISISMFCVTLAIIFKILSEKRSLFSLLSYLFYILSLFPLFTYFGAIFKIIHIPTYTLLLCVFFYVALASVIAILLKKQKPLTYIYLAASYFSTALLNCLTFLALIYKTSLYTPFTFTGSLILLAVVIFESLNSNLLKIKAGTLISKLGIFLAYDLLCTGVILMIWG